MKNIFGHDLRLPGKRTNNKLPSMEPGRHRISMEAWLTPERKKQMDKKKRDRGVLVPE